MFPYTVKIISHCTHSEYSPERFGDWSESYNNYFDNIRVGGEYPDVVSSLDFQPGDDVYVVWIEWSEGDSFGWADNRGTDVLAIFNNAKDASELEKLIRSTKDFTPNLEYKSSDGQNISIYPSWVGYFDRLEHVHIEHEVMGKGIGR